MAKTAGDAYKHMHSLGGLFGDADELSEVIINEFLKAHKKRKYLRQGLRRLIDRGIIEKKQSKYLLTKAGARFFKKYREPTPKKEWDGKWRLVSFDVPGEYNPKRDSLRYLLKEYGFLQLQKSVWICPNHIAQDFWEEVVKSDLADYCKVMLVEIIEGDEDFRKAFNLDQGVKKR